MDIVLNFGKSLFFIVNFYNRIYLKLTGNESLNSLNVIVNIILTFTTIILIKLNFVCVSSSLKLGLNSINEHKNVHDFIYVSFIFIAGFFAIILTTIQHLFFLSFIFDENFFHSFNEK